MNSLEVSGLNQLVKPGRKLSQRQLNVSVITTLLITVLMYLSLGIDFSISALTGGLISIIPNTVFAYKAFRYAGATSSKKVIESFYAGEKIKLVLTAFLFALAFKYLAIVPLPFFLTYFVVMIMSLLTPILFKL